ncbi:hypothetical protein DIPPA_70077 [Diplonema papillatum]|nr:hypothetical protein DIPPA_70077 [Diplonema papillatum]
MSTSLLLPDSRPEWSTGGSKTPDL